ncbi:MAG: NAD(P)H-dependent glycerol-3-phosphate dehydrogenase [Nitrospirota bacterium]
MTDRGVAVIGAGAWGTALAHLIAGTGRPVRLWCYEPEVAEAIAARRENTRYLPGIALASGIAPTTDLAAAVSDAEAVLMVVPSHALRGVFSRVASVLPTEVPVVSATKGIEVDSLALMTDVMRELLPAGRRHPLAVLSGPSFAAEVAKGHPTAVTLACRDPNVARQLQELLTTTAFKLFTTPDVIGVQIGGALKNVIALAAGGSDGLGFGANTRAALITRGLAEISRLGVAMGGQPWTFSGLSGLGDLILTCTDRQSRNFTVGYRIGRGETLDAIVRGASTVAEGVMTTRAAYALSRKHRVLMPIVEQVYAVLYEGKDPRKAVTDLMEPSVGDELFRPPERGGWGNGTAAG